jgi:hypothetical protein
MDKEINIIDAILMQKKVYNIIISGLAAELITNISKILESDFNAIVLNYNHLELDDNLTVVNDRVNDILLKKKDEPQIIIIIGKLFVAKKIKFQVDYHIHLSINKTLFLELYPDKTSEYYDNYADVLKTNYVNKYMNVKKESDINEIINNIFDLIIENIEKILYGDKFNALSHKFYNPENQNHSEKQNDEEVLRLVSNETVFNENLKEKNDRLLQNAETELSDAMQDIDDEIDILKSDDDIDFLAENIRIN